MSYNKDTKMYEGYIYRIYNNYNKRCYIGQTIIDVKTRYCQHLFLAKTDSPQQIIHQAMKKHGVDNYFVEIIEKCVNKDKNALYLILDQKEMHYINKYNSYYKNENGGYNMTIGGRNPSSNSGRKRSVYCYYKDGTYIGFFERIVDAADLFGIDRKAIDYSLLKNTISTFGYYFSDKKEFSPQILYGTKRHIKLYDMSYNLIGIFVSVSEAMRFIGVGDKAGRSQIYRYLKGQNKHAFGYIWETATDEDVANWESMKNDEN